MRFELDSQVLCTTFLHERDASVRSFPDEVRSSTVSREDRLPTTTAQILTGHQHSESKQQLESTVMAPVFDGHDGVVTLVLLIATDFF